VLAGVIFNLYGQGVRAGGREAPPQIVAEPGPFRTPPADPGATQTPNQDKAIYEGEAAGGLRVEQVDALEQPRIAQVQAAPALAPPEDLRPKDRQPLPDLRPRDAAKVAPPETPKAAPPAPVAARPAQQAAAPIARPAAPPPAAASAPAPAPAAAAAPPAAGSVSVQLGAFGSEALARSAWSRLGAVAAGRAPQISTVERDGKTLYRLRTGGFASRAEAQAFCGRATGSGLACIVAGS
jgi:cell division protein FtsN